MLFSAGQRIVFIGDSVTDCDRRGAVRDGYLNPARSLVTPAIPGSA